MKRSARDQWPLFDPWFDWQELPDETRQHVLDVLTALCLGIVDLPNWELESDDSSDN